MAIREKEQKIKDVDIELLWKEFKNCVTEAAKTVCGTTTRRNKTMKKTASWSIEIKAEMKKKSYWQGYLNDRTEMKWEMYKEQRKKVKKEDKITTEIIKNIGDE
ncbi:hypothetical protein HHI36_017022 [Cryptolaemus montrouzieri]|uniref:Uncharacterized protein n=1 Tax=Cryptolaemus montrouzieri TaxID=559131 RepID=A0ABD2NLF9_9CUCU